MMAEMEYGFAATFQENENKTIMATDGSRSYWDEFGDQTTIVWWSE